MKKKLKNYYYFVFAGTEGFLPKAADGIDTSHEYCMRVSPRSMLGKQIHKAAQKHLKGGWK